MEFDAVLFPPRRAAMVEKGFWRDRTINDDLDDCLKQRPDKEAVTAISIDRGETRRLTYRELARLSDRLAASLARLGVERNDVVSAQLPNWWEFTVAYLACARTGAVFNPLMPIFRERELGFMLKHARSKVVIVPKRFRGHDYESMIGALRPALPDLRHVLVIGGKGDSDFGALLQGNPDETTDARAVPALRRPAPDEITEIIYTSGTTGEPKGVMHSSNSLTANIIPYAERLHLGAGDVVLMASPMAHQTGFLYGLFMPITLGARAVLQDIWDPRKAVETIRHEGATFTMASTPFLTDLANVVAETGLAVPTLRTFLCAGAPIPGPLVERARKTLGTKIVSAWGMTENGAATLIKPEDDDERAFNTCGCPLPGVELRVVDSDGTPLPNGTSGRLLIRACSNFGGYLHRPHLNGTDADDWFDTGDLASIDDRGYVRIDGRSKDVIIRGGENIPVVEIEALLYKHPAVAQAAIVAYPDERLGERACAVIVTKPGQSIDFAEMVDFLKAQKVALQYIPERLMALDQMPSTPSGKIQKFKLREIVKDGLSSIQAAADG
ncbi:cyclohexanecarboxylate-CoA ligase [Enhydrobacter sp.]|jgi:cyclohexanecarboxylate-CoA ligase|uniref:cyclohexanecarboxylate-CoA ligase n=1 Tax=Enhydrobacter sp. TaxID=1894999 RepID=UPI0026081777|nr:cyclohexanecarboxylate-CoA ligase [Enhydrobacter sp.]WIM11537.1 MAG: Cyclohexanecarboxylate--CoA ligase [Enhydrobacter sp.]